MQNNLMRYMANPKSYVLKKWFSDLLKEKYVEHEPIIERVSSSLITDKDLEEFSKLITHLYHSAYHKAINDYKEQAEKLGLKISIS